MLADSIRILIADDHPIIRMSLRRLLETDLRFKITGEAENGLVAVALVEELEPDVVLLDVNMPLLDGIESACIISSRFPAKVVILTMHDDPAISRQAFNAGASSVLIKGCSQEKTLGAVWWNGNMRLTGSMPIAQSA